jgi:hypothetical protein
MYGVISIFIFHRLIPNYIDIIKKICDSHFNSIVLSDIFSPGTSDNL